MKENKLFFIKNNFSSKNIVIPIDIKILYLKKKEFRFAINKSLKLLNHNYFSTDLSLIIHYLYGYIRLNYF